MSFDIQGKNVLITGANRGIGKEILKSCLQHGAAKVYAGVRKLENADGLVAEFGEKIVPVVVDLNDKASIAAAAEAAADVDVVVNNAGVLRNCTPLAADAEEALQFEIETNVFGLMRMAQAFAPVLAANGGGVFAQLNSVASMKCFADFATYSASKAAAYSITQALRDLLAEQGTTVISIHPGPVATEMAHNAGLTEIADSPATVGEGLIAAMNSGEFHVFPDKMAGPLGAAYESFAKGVIEQTMQG